MNYILYLNEFMRCGKSRLSNGIHLAMDDGILPIGVTAVIHGTKVLTYINECDFSIRLHYRSMILSGV